MTEEQTDEEIARTLGWHPLEEFKGDPETFVDAEEYVKRGMDNLPILQSNVKRQATRIDKLERIVEDQKAYNDRNLASQRESMQAAYDKELERIVADGDEEAFKNLKKPEVSTGGLSPEDQQVYNSFIAGHDWYGTDTVLTAAAGAISAELANKFPGLSADQNLAKTLIRLKAEFPKKFGNGVEEEEEEEVISRVEAGRRTIKKKSGRGYSDLPAEDKVVCDNFIKEGIIKDQDAYVASYQWEK